MSKKIHIIGGGTMYHVRPHLALCAPAYGGTANTLFEKMTDDIEGLSMHINLHMTKMADYESTLETNEDISNLIDEIVADEEPSIVIMSAALCDYTGSILGPFAIDISLGTTASGKDQPRLKTSEGTRLLQLKPSEKIISKIRKTRKDIFLVGFKTTAGAELDEQYFAGLELLKKASCNLVLANDLHTRTNMIVTPEQARYCVTQDRDKVLDTLVEMIAARSDLHFTRSTVVEGKPVQWHSGEIPDTLRTVVNHCIKNKAYKPFLGKTVGHFAAKIGDNQFLTSIRKSNFNELSTTGLVRVETQDDDKVIAYGAKPSVGGQSQRIIFREHPDTDCIVHFHCPLKSKPVDDIPVRSQREYECGSHECGQNTSNGLRKFDDIYAVMLDQHGPNIVFNKNVEPSKVINFIERNFELSGRTDNVMVS